jgi:hypothetical protein
MATGDGVVTGIFCHLFGGCVAVPGILTPATALLPPGTATTACRSAERGDGGHFESLGVLSWHLGSTISV